MTTRRTRVVNSTRATGSAAKVTSVPRLSSTSNPAELVTFKETGVLSFKVLSLIRKVKQISCRVHVHGVTLSTFTTSPHLLRDRHGFGLNYIFPPQINLSIKPLCGDQSQSEHAISNLRHQSTAEQLGRRFCRFFIPPTPSSGRLTNLLFGAQAANTTRRRKGSRNACTRVNRADICRPVTKPGAFKSTRTDVCCPSILAIRSAACSWTSSNCHPPVLALLSSIITFNF